MFVTPASLWSFRLPNRLGPSVEVSDWFFIKPLLRAVTFPKALLDFLADLGDRLVQIVRVREG